MAINDKERQYRYFLYSRSQQKELQKINSTTGKNYVPGRVLVDGDYKDYTQISESPDNPAYSDAHMVCKGYLDEITYIEPTTKWKALMR